MIAINFFQFFAICLKARNFSNIKHIGGVYTKFIMTKKIFL
jgi:hypothetical protein